MLMAQSGDEESMDLGVVVGRLLSVVVLPNVGEAVLVVLGCALYLMWLALSSWGVG
jgi:hypothetical protein